MATDRHNIRSDGSSGSAQTHASADLEQPQKSRDQRGRTAEEPAQIPARGWWDISWRVMKRLGSDNVSLVAGGLALYALLSIFPGLTAIVSVYGLFTTPADVEQQMSTFSGVLPPGVWDIFKTQLQSIVSHQQGTLTATAAVGVLLALWSARSAMSSLMSATNIAYGEREKRGWFVQVLLSLGFTVGAIVGFSVMLTLGVLIPLALQVLGTSEWVQAAAGVLRFALLWITALLGLAVIYRYAPAREHARWRWVTWGSAIAATLWLIATALFALYVRTFGSYGKTYGALGSVVVLLMWFYISSLIVVLGAEINAEMERQTRKDTTVRKNAPLGQRGAYAADTVGPEAGKGEPQKVSQGKNTIAQK
jgi:membrane protein